MAYRRRRRLKPRSYGRRRRFIRRRPGVRRIFRRRRLGAFRRRAFLRSSRLPRSEGRWLSKRDPRRGYVDASTLIDTKSTILTYNTYHDVAVPDTERYNAVTYRANSCHDPEYALGGGAPLHWASYVASFHYYQVYGCSAKFTFFPDKVWFSGGPTAAVNQTTFRNGVVLMVWFSRTDLWPANTEAIMGQRDKPAVKKRIIFMHDGTRPTTIRVFTRLKHQILPCQRNNATNYSKWTATNANPGTPIYLHWHISRINPDATTGITGILKTSIKYYTQLQWNKSKDTPASESQLM